MSKKYCIHCQNTGHISEFDCPRCNSTGLKKLSYDDQVINMADALIQFLVEHKNADGSISYLIDYDTLLKIILEGFNLGTKAIAEIPVNKKE